MYIINIFENNSFGGFVDSLQDFASREDAERGVETLQQEDAEDGCPNIYRYEIIEQNPSQRS